MGTHAPSRAGQEEGRARGQPPSQVGVAVTSTHVCPRFSRSRQVTFTAPFPWHFLFKTGVSRECDQHAQTRTTPAVSVDLIGDQNPPVFG